MTQHDALLAAVCAAPDDDLPRLVFADWCDENGDPARAEFIRTQIEIANGAKSQKLAKLQKRETELLAEHEVKWTEALVEFIDNFYGEPLVFRRGFVEDLCTHCSTLPECGDELFRLAPIRRLTMCDVGSYEELAACPYLSRIVSLDLTGAPLHSDRGTHLLFSSPFLTNLETLIARDGQGEDLDCATLSAIAQSNFLRHLRKLELGQNWLFGSLPVDENTETARLLMALGNLPSLTELHLDCTGMLTSTVCEFATQSWLRRLTVLDLSRNPVGGEGARALVESPHLEQIELLKLTDINTRVGHNVTPLTDDAKRLLLARFGERVQV